RTRLRVRTIQNGALAASSAAHGPTTDAVDDEVGLVTLVERRVQAHGIAALAAGPQVLAESAGVVADQGVGRIENGARRAIVLFKPEQLCARLIAAELMQILHARAAPAVDRLVVVADGERQSLGAG